MARGSRSSAGRGGKLGIFVAVVLVAGALVGFRILGSPGAYAQEPRNAEEARAVPSPPVQKESGDYVLVDAGDLKMAVGFQLAREDRDNHGFVPLVVSILNLRHKHVRIRKDEFHLYGEGGAELPLASLKEVRSGYRWYRQDSQLISTGGFLSSLPYAGEYQPTTFFPVPGSVGIYAITLDFKQTFIDFLYFLGEGSQRLRLVAEANDTRPALEASFVASPAGR